MQFQQERAVPTAWKDVSFETHSGSAGFSFWDSWYFHGFVAPLANRYAACCRYANNNSPLEIRDSRDFACTAWDSAAQCLPGFLEHPLGLSSRAWRAIWSIRQKGCRALWSLSISSFEGRSGWWARICTFDYAIQSLHYKPLCILNQDKQTSLCCWQIHSITYSKLLCPQTKGERTAARFSVVELESRHSSHWSSGAFSR